jgi:hypothetical protein
MRLGVDLFGHADGAAVQLDSLDRDLRPVLDPKCWRESSREGRMDMARSAYLTVCKCLRLTAFGLEFTPYQIGPLSRRDPLTGRLIASMLLIDEEDPSGMLRALILEGCRGIEERSVRTAPWLGPMTWKKIRQLLGAGSTSDQPKCGSEKG